MIKDLSFFDRVSVLVIGDIMLDRYIWGNVQRISPEAPVPVVKFSRETNTAGGAANVAVNLAALGVRCAVAGLVGNDAGGQQLGAAFAQHGIGFDPRLVRPEVATITKTRIIAQRQQVCRLDLEADRATYSFGSFGLLGILPEIISGYDAVILSDYAKGTIDQQVINLVRDFRTNHRCFVALDPKPSRPLEISGMDLLTPNRGEAVQLAGPGAQEQTESSHEELAKLVLERHRPKCLVMTLSEHGMLLCRPDEAPQIFPTVAHQVADVSGAGDTVVAVLTAAMAAGVEPEEAVHIANAAAGLVVAKLGTATVNRAELLGALNPRRLD